jgi:hypothetical protein
MQATGDCQSSVPSAARAALHAVDQFVSPGAPPAWQKCNAMVKKRR